MINSLPAQFVNTPFPYKEYNEKEEIIMASQRPLQGFDHLEKDGRCYAKIDITLPDSVVSNTIKENIRKGGYIPVFVRKDEMAKIALYFVPDKYKSLYDGMNLEKVLLQKIPKDLKYEDAIKAKQFSIKH